MARTYPPCTGGEPPSCCQAPFAERKAAVDAALERSRASYPTACPQCGSDEVFWIFDVERRYFECPAGHVWEDAR